MYRLIAFYSILLGRTRDFGDGRVALLYGTSCLFLTGMVGGMSLDRKLGDHFPLPFA